MLALPRLPADFGSFLLGDDGERTMKKIAWSAGFVILGALAAADSACTVTVNGDDGGNPPTDDGGGAVETSTGIDTGTQPDVGTTVDTGAPDVNSANDSGTGSDGPVCTPTTADPCEVCVSSHCCAESTACGSGPAVDDAGLSDCEEIVDCYQGPTGCTTPDSGFDAGECTTVCEAGHTTQGQADFAALFNCTAQHCATECGM
jgi:hypothetical protein